MFNFIEFLINGLFQFRWWWIVLFVPAMCHLTLLTITVFFHRTETHRALVLHPILRAFFRFWGWLTTGQIPKEWAAIHNKHHAMVDREGDPHSPQVHGLLKVLREGAELYRDGLKDLAVLKKLSDAPPGGWFERNLFGNKHGVMKYSGVGLMLIIDTLLFGVLGLTVWALQMLCIPVLAAGIINGFGHWPLPKEGRFFFYRNSDTGDWSVNIVSIGVIVCGEELHNNHHDRPISAQLSMKKGEFDLGWQYIRFFAWCGLAKINHTMPQID